MFKCDRQPPLFLPKTIEINKCDKPSQSTWGDSEEVDRGKEVIGAGNEKKETRCFVMD